MKALKIYESTILADNSEHAAHMIVLPFRSPLGTEWILSELEMSRIVDVKRATNLAPSLAVLFSSGVPSADRRDRLIYTNSFGARDFRVAYTDYDLEFAEIIAFEPVIPFEASPLQLHVLATLVTKASGVAIGAFAGFVAVGPSPFLLVTVPAGMIICGAAKPVAEALESGLRDKLQRFLKRLAVEDESPEVQAEHDDTSNSPRPRRHPLRRNQ